MSSLLHCMLTCAQLDANDTLDTPAFLAWYIIQ